MHRIFFTNCTQRFAYATFCAYLFCFYKGTHLNIIEEKALYAELLRKAQTS